jgi:hypothetical protein
MSAGVVGRSRSGQKIPAPISSEAGACPRSNVSGLIIFRTSKPRAPDDKFQQEQALDAAEGQSLRDLCCRTLS